MEILIPVATGIESVVKRQLYKLGYEDTKAINGRIAVNGDFFDIARLNVFLRSGERVLLVLGKFHAESFDELYSGVNQINWEDYLSKHAKILIDGKAVKSKLGAIKASGGIVKKAIANRLVKAYGLHSDYIVESGERVIVGVSIYEDDVTITIDTSGDGLHKRGYRSLAYSAPLKETTAAAMIDMSYYNKDKMFADLFCGSGTLPIECAMKALNIAPGKNRDFDFKNWICTPKNALESALIEAKDLEKLDTKLEIFASDINPKAISIAKYHAKQAGVERYIHFKEMDMRKFTQETPFGVMISNPPYAERLGEVDEVKALYKDLGKVYKSLPDWNMYILTGFKGPFEKIIGKNADKKCRIFNANIECWYYSYLSKNKPSK